MDRPVHSITNPWSLSSRDQKWLWTQTEFYESAEDFALELCCNQMFFPEDRLAPIGSDARADYFDSNRFLALKKIWNAAQLPFKEFLALLGLSAQECSDRYCIPYPTIHSWTSGKHNPPLHIRILLARAEGFL